MSQLDEDIRAAAELGFPSYGKYIAWKYENSVPMAAPPQKKKRHPQRPRKFTDHQAFTLWQTYMTDAEIGSTLGVSRAYIQRWRDQLELPSTSHTRIDTKKYRLAALQDGTTIAIKEDDEL